MSRQAAPETIQAEAAQPQPQAPVQAQPAQPQGEAVGQALIDQADTQVAQAQAEQPEAPAKPKGPSEQELAQLLEDFKIKAHAVVSQHDAAGQIKIEVTTPDQVAESGQSSGSLYPEFEAALNAYQALPGASPKGKAKDFMGGQMTSEILKIQANPSDLSPQATVIAWNIFQTAVLERASKKAGAAGPALSPVDGFLAKLATIRVANKLIADDQPEGLPTDWQEQLNKMVQVGINEAELLEKWQETPEDERQGEEPKLSAYTSQAVKLSSGKGPRKPGRPVGAVSTYTGVRRDIGKHIEHAFSDKPSGTWLSINEIRSIQSPEYGEASPSGGAISARLFPKSGKSATVEGVEAALDASGRKGARKL